ncbi:hypothetical protein [Paenibacillus sp. sgz500958]|uniref:hypothetical protein n=1 Tax=Paenibacillus sp. sgz500958 TaxID=3242475 RepID=UPI0036D3BF93
MRILISQPCHEAGLIQLREEMKRTDLFDAVLYPEGYVQDEHAVHELSGLARQFRKLIITGYKDVHNKDRALIINANGEIILERTKSPMQGELYRPSTVVTEDLSIGYLLCVELLQGLAGLEGQAERFDFIAHPIGVGMFSDEQFALWINEAASIAVKYNTFVIGTSHADGSYRNCGISIPISYCIDATGAPVYVSRNDIRSRVLDLNSREVELWDAIPKMT